MVCKLVGWWINLFLARSNPEGGNVALKEEMSHDVARKDEGFIDRYYIFYLGIHP